MKTLSTILLCIFLAGAFHAVGQTYTLDDCIRIALENNQQFKNSQLDATAADYMIKEVKSELLPTINLGGQYQYYQDMPSQYAPASAFGGPEGQFNKLTLAMRQTTTAQLQVTQNVYNQAVFTGLKAAKVMQEASLLQVDYTRENLIYNVSATFYSVQVLQDNLKRLADNISNLERTVQVNESLKANEIVPENVHSRMLINLENLRNQFENQQLLLDKNMTSLKTLLNVEDAFTIVQFDYQSDYLEPEAGDIMQRTDIRLQHAQVRLAEFDKRSVLAAYYPTLTNSFHVGYAGYYDSFAPFQQINNDWIKSSYMQLTLRIPVFDGFKKHHQVRQKEIAVQKNINTLSSLKSNASKEVEDAMNNYQTNKTLLASNKKSLDLAEQLFTSSQQDYESGLTSITEFLNAQNDLTNARTNYSNALLNLKLAELSLKKANGTLLTHY
jgi:outer membrane protein TolC